MIRKTRIAIATVLCSLFTLGAQAQDAHWTVSAYDYQYDMTAYVALTDDNVAVDDYTGYELAAFCGDECRGVATWRTVGDNTYGYLRIRSNQQEGETITFKVYVREMQKEVDADFTLTFKALDVAGLPSSPQVLSILTVLAEKYAELQDAVTGLQQAVDNIDPDALEAFDDVAELAGQAAAMAANYTAALQQGGMTADEADSAIAALNAKLQELKEATPLRGDPTRDGEITISDVVMAVSFTLETAVPDAKQKWAADMNKSNDITVSDVVAIVSAVLQLATP